MSNAQELHLQKQKGYEYEKARVLDSLKLPEPDFKLIDFEIRIWYINWKVTKYNHKITRIFKHKNGLWTGNSYSFFYYNSNHYDFNNIKSEQLVFKDSWIDSWNTILSKNYLNLPDEEDLPIKETNRFPWLSATDGEEYIIYVLTQPIKRRMAYGSPCLQLDYYSNKNIDCEMLKCFIDFISILNREFSIDFKEKNH